MMGFFKGLIQRVRRQSPSPDQRADRDARDAARKYWQRKVSTEDGSKPPAKAAPSKADTTARKSARKYWQRKVSTEDGSKPPAKAAPSKADTEAQESAHKYWKREVADEKKRRGTPDPPQKR